MDLCFAIDNFWCREKRKVVNCKNAILAFGANFTGLYAIAKNTLSSFAPTDFA
jgi:hypothetical protein